jgi:inhibitor of cysteine peptidase
LHEKDGIMKKHIPIAGLSMFCLIIVVVAGCTGPGQMKPENQTTLPAPAVTAVEAGHYVFSGEQNNTTVSMKKGSTITLRLDENPTTGYQWNLTVTPGLKVIGDTYVPSDTTGKLVGSGGIHIWEITADDPGQQQIQAAYKRSWEPVTGNETSFRMWIVVE